jgi:hypothetical protein
MVPSSSSRRVRRLVLAVLVPCLLVGAAWACRGAWADGDDDVTSRDVEQAFRTLRDAVRGGVEFRPATIDHVHEALSGWGARQVERTEQQVLRFAWGERTLVIVFGAGTGGDVILRYQHGRAVGDAEALNTWNSQALTMGYIDRRQDTPTLELNVLAESTPTVDEMKGLLGRFAIEVERFATQMDAVPAPDTTEGN